MVEAIRWSKGQRYRQKNSGRADMRDRQKELLCCCGMPNAFLPVDTVECRARCRVLLSCGKLDLMSVTAPSEGGTHVLLIKISNSRPSHVYRD